MMYQIEYMGQIVYGPDVAHCVLDPKLDEELNSAGTFTFTVPVENETLWRDIEVFKGEVRIYEGDDIIWFGRPLQIVRNWKNQKVVTCEGALAYFNDSIQATHEYNNIPLYGPNGFLNTIIALHNDQVRINQQDHSHEFKIGTIDIDNEQGIYRQVDYQTTAEVLQQMCLDTNGGYFVLRKAVDPEDGNLKSYIDWYKEMPYGTSQEIQFGLNLLDLNQDLNGADICTAVLAFGKDDKTVSGLTKWNNVDNPYVMASGSRIYHDGEFIYHIDAYEKYGRVLKIKSWSDMSAVGQDNKENLFIKAAQWLEDQNTETTTIECSAADLHYLSEHADKGKLRIGQTVIVTSAVHGIEAKQLPIYKISMSLDSGAKTITMGTPPKRELTDIVKNSGGSTRGSSGTTGGGGGSSGGSGGSGTVSVKDVQVKYPGDENYRTVVSKKVAKIDLSGITGGVSDVEIDGTSIVHDGVASIITDDIVEANPQGDAIGDLGSISVKGVKYRIPSSGNAVIDVQLDDESVVNPSTHIAKIYSRDIIEQVEGNFEHIVHEFVDDEDPNPSKDYGRVTDILMGYSEDEYGTRESIINSSNYVDYSVTPIASSSYAKWTQDFVVQPTGYYDPYDLDEHGNPKWKYDPESPERVYHTHTFDNPEETGVSVFYGTVAGEYHPYTGHTITTKMKGTALLYTSGSVDFVYHEAGKKYKPTNLQGIFFTSAIEDLEDEGIGPKQELYMGVGNVAIFVSNDGTNWTRVNNTNEEGSPSDGFYATDFDCDEYYEYIKLSLTSMLYTYIGWTYFDLYAEPFYEIDTIWFKNSKYSWRKLKKIHDILANPQETTSTNLTKIMIDGVPYNVSGSVTDVQIDGTSIVDAQGVADIDSSMFGTDVEANPTGQSVGYLTAIRIENNIYDIPTGGGGGGGTVVRYNIVTKSTGGWDAAITINKYVNNTLESSVDYLYTSLQSQDVDIDGCFTINYGISIAYSYTMRLTKSSTTNPAGYSYSWQYNQSVDFDQTFVKQIVYVDDLYDACVANNVTPASHDLVDIIAAILGNV